MAGTREGVDPPTSAPWDTYGGVIAISGAVTAGVGLVLAGESPVVAAVLVGVSVGMGAWLGVRGAAARVAGWPPSASGCEGSDEGVRDTASAGSVARTGSDR